MSIPDAHDSPTKLLSSITRGKFLEDFNFLFRMTPGGT